jgi:GTP-binding protein
MTFTLAIIGRPNVGKSTLFNRLVGRKLALVDDRPGVTRDRREGEARLGGAEFNIIDTAGLDDTRGDDLLSAMRGQTELAVAQADVLLFMIDARTGVTPIDEAFAQELRKTDKPIILAANKAEGKAGEGGLLEAFSLGLGEPIRLSAAHGEGLGDLYDALMPHIEAYVEADDVDEEADKSISLAILGRPNAGKSTLINQLLGEERLLAGPQAGMTRDAISIEWQWRGTPIKLIDTAGMRKRARVKEKLEKLAVADALRAMRYAECVVLVIDALKPFDKQDLQIADLVVREGRALVIAVNKWDMVEDKRALRKTLDEEVERLLPQMRGVKLVYISALKGGKGLDRMMQAVLNVYEAWNRRVSTGNLNRWLEGAVHAHNPPASRGRRIKLRYITQAKSRPPTFIVFCSKPEALPESYSRYLINDLRDVFDLPSVPIRLHLRKGDNPYAPKKGKH